MRTRVLIPIMFLALQLAAQVRMDAITASALARLQVLAKEHPDPRRLVEVGEEFPLALIGGRPMLGLLAKVDGQWAQTEDPAVMKGATVGDIASFRMDARELDRLTSLPGLQLVQLAAKAAPTLDKLVKAVRADSVHQGIDLPASYTGKDVFIGITDWGFDYTHPAFYDTSLTATRIHAAWDQYRQSGPSPQGFPYGTELSTPEALLAMQSDTANIYSFHTHGTHVAGIAGGSGAGTVYRGVAFEARFLFCTFLIDAAAVVDAFSWMQQIAQQEGRRLVVNMSWGLHHIGTLDGNSLISQVIGQMAQEGVVFVSSAGNNGDADFHIRKEFQNDTLRSRLQFYTSADPKVWGQSISMWGAPGASFAAGITITNGTNEVLQEGPWYQTATQAAYLDTFLLQGNDTIFYNLTTDAAHPLNGRPHFRLRIKRPTGGLRVGIKAAAPEGIVHFWNVTELTTGVGNWGQAFQAPATGWTAGDRNYGIGEPACTEQLVAVAAYNSEYLSQTGIPLGGAIANFSSFGPTLDERMKPDLAAPGMNVASAVSAFTDASFTTTTTVSFGGTTYPFARFSGTSMSSPAVAGVAALLLEADPDLSAAAVREVLRATARTDNHTGVITGSGSTRWGMGKVNAYHAVREVLGITGMAERTGGRLLTWPNPANDQVQVIMPVQGGMVALRVMDVTGRVVHDAVLPVQEPMLLHTAAWPAGVYVIQLTQDGRSFTGRIVRQ
jgi:minor extracellular serine protease Vpr